MKLDQIKLLKVGDIVVDKVSEAEFIVTDIKEEIAYHYAYN